MPVLAAANRSGGNDAADLTANGEGKMQTWEARPLTENILLVARTAADFEDEEFAQFDQALAGEPQRQPGAVFGGFDDLAGVPTIAKLAKTLCFDA
jgi:hypothetical protein